MFRRYAKEETAVSTRKLSIYLFGALFITLIALTSTLGGLNRSQIFAAEVAATPPRLYLPIVIGSNGSVTTPTATATSTAVSTATSTSTTTATATATATPTATATTPSSSAKKAFFVETNWKTNSASIAIDAQGGNHLAYAYYEAVADGAPTSGVYLYCASDCDKEANWSGVAMGEGVKEIQVALTPQGQPRVLYRINTLNNGSEFYYAACDQSCTDPAEWTVTLVTSNRGMTIVEFGEDDLPQRYFALDPQGRPRFVYSDRDTWRTPAHIGTFYIFCDQDCTNAANWSEVRINQDNGTHSRFEKFLYPSLTFTASGQPRILADGTSMQDEMLIFYLACDTGCNQFDNWQRLPLFERGSLGYVSYDIEINGQGQPRVAFYQGSMLEGKGDRLSYAWCNGGCLEANNWQRRELGLPMNDGRGPDLELDGAGRPRIAYALHSTGGLGYAQCNTQCEEASAQWQLQVVESRNDLLASWPVAHPPHCDGGLWDGLTPSLALDKNGAPRIAYDATYHARCIYIPETGEWKPWHQFHLLRRAVRLVIPPYAGGGAPVTVTPTGSVTATPTATATPTQTPTSTPTATTQPPPARLGVGLFMDTQWRTSSSAVAVDGNNGAHMAYVYFEPIYTEDTDGDANPTTAVYRYCPANCNTAGNWQSVSLGEGVSEVQIGLTPAGQPRLLLLERAQNFGEPADRYVYAECDQNCGSRNQWRLTAVATVPNELSWRWESDPQDMNAFYREYQARRYFALDPAGRPRFVYYHYNAEADANGVGAYYAACDGDCATGSNWTHTRITKVQDWSGQLEWEVLEKPVLTFTQQGQPRLLGLLLPTGILRFPGLYYLACDSDCHHGDNWFSVLVGQNGDENGYWDIAIDGAGRPRAAVSKYVSSRGYVLSYIWCEAECLNMESWQRAEVAEDVEQPDLALNEQGQPRIAFKHVEYDDQGNNPADTLSYLVCNTNCESVTGQWQQTRVENSQHLQAEWTGSHPPACTDGEWHIIVPSLTLDGGGTLRAAYDAHYIAKCEYDPAAGAWIPGGQFTYNVVWRAAREVHFPQP